MPDVAPVARPSSLRKRAAVLAAGRALFLGEGYDRTSVDSIAARAGISKRTVYDYFGDKNGVIDAVLGDVATEIAANIRAAVDDELTTDRNIRDALLAFARRTATRTFASSEYWLLRRLSHEGRPIVGHDLATLDDLPTTLVAERFDEFARQGTLATADARRAAQHFIALTFLLVLDVTRLTPGRATDIDSLLVDGVDAFLRAYHG